MPHSGLLGPSRPKHSPADSRTMVVAERWTAQRKGRAPARQRVALSGSFDTGGLGRQKTRRAASIADNQAAQAKNLDAALLVFELNTPNPRRNPPRANRRCPRSRRNRRWWRRQSEPHLRRLRLGSKRLISSGLANPCQDRTPHVRQSRQPQVCCRAGSEARAAISVHVTWKCEFVEPASRGNDRNAS